MRLTDRELATVLAALRHWQDEFPDNMGDEEREEMLSAPQFYNDDGIDRSPLTGPEIDTLIEDTLNVKEPAPTVHVVTYDWRNWCRDVVAFTSEAQAKQHVIDNANEAGADADLTDYDAALESLTEAGHSVYVDTLTLVQ